MKDNREYIFDLDTDLPDRPVDYIWSGQAIHDIYANKTFQILNSTYTWEVRSLDQLKEEELFELYRRVYNKNADEVKQHYIDRLKEHQLAILAMCENGEVHAFIPLMRYAFGWKTSFLGHINSFRVTIGVNSFFTVLTQSNIQIPYSLQVSGKIAIHIIKHSSFPVVPFNVVKKIKGKRAHRFAGETISLDAQTENLLSEKEHIKNEIYLTEIKFLNRKGAEWKVMMGKVILFQPEKFFNRPLESWIDSSHWHDLCEKLHKTPRKGYSSMGYFGRDRLSIYQHTERVAKAALALSHGSNLDEQEIYAYAMIHDFIESVTGDIMPGKLSSEEKWKLEKKAWEDTVLPTVGDRAWPMYQIWLSYEKQETKEAKLVWMIDKMEPLTEGIEFFNRHPLIAIIRKFVTKSIIRKIKSKINHPVLKQIAYRLKKVKVQKDFNFDKYLKELKNSKF